MFHSCRFCVAWFLFRHTFLTRPPPFLSRLDLSRLALVSSRFCRIIILSRVLYVAWSLGLSVSDLLVSRPVVSWSPDLLVPSRSLDLWSSWSLGLLVFRLRT